MSISKSKANDIITGIENDVALLKAKWSKSGVAEDVIDKHILISLMSKALSRGQNPDEYLSYIYPSNSQ
jgi:hypothetical protein